MSHIFCGYHNLVSNVGDNHPEGNQVTSARTAEARRQEADTLNLSSPQPVQSSLCSTLPADADKGNKNNQSDRSPHMCDGCSAFRFWLRF